LIEAEFDDAGVFIPTGGYKIALFAFDRAKVPDTHTRVLSGGPTSTLLVSVMPFGPRSKFRISCLVPKRNQPMLASGKFGLELDCYHPPFHHACVATLGASVLFDATYLPQALLSSPPVIGPPINGIFVPVMKYLLHWSLSVPIFGQDGGMASRIGGNSLFHRRHQFQSSSVPVVPASLSGFLLLRQGGYRNSRERTAPMRNDEASK
jgi:hypothetical protein